MRFTRDRQVNTRQRNRFSNAVKRPMFIVALTLLTGCSSTLNKIRTSTNSMLNDEPNQVELDHVPKEKPEKLRELDQKESSTGFASEGDAEIKQIRMKTLKQAAFSWGVQEGMFWRYQQIMDLMNRQPIVMSTVFEFNTFLVDGKMLCPVVIEAERIYEQTNDKTVRTVTASLTLEKNARLVPQAPTWRDYLTRTIDKPVEPDAVLFPRDDEEKSAWRNALNKGWEAGVLQADNTYEHDLRILQKDIEGMYRFRKLLAQGIVSLPTLQSSNMSFVKEGKTVNLNDVIYSITVESDFTDTNDWQPFFRLQSQRPN